MCILKACWLLRLLNVFFQAGVSIAHSLAAVLEIPCYHTSHQQGHLHAALHNSPKMPEKYLGSYLSAGTTDLLMVSLTIAASFDLYAGQLIDRIGVSMGLRLPAGSGLQKLASCGLAIGRYVVKLEGMSCHFSGAEAHTLHNLPQGVISNEDIAAEVFDFLAKTAFGMLQAAQKRKASMMRSFLAVLFHQNWC